MKKEMAKNSVLILLTRVGRTISSGQPSCCTDLV